MSFALAFGTYCDATSAQSTWTINTCNDVDVGDLGTRTGSLRFAAANAVSGDTIDLTRVTCSTISLTNGSIALAQDDITLNGPGMNHLVITGKSGASVEHDQVIRHSGHGWLKMRDLSITYGYLDPQTTPSRGGCVGSMGSVTLDHVAITHCRNEGQYLSGGGVSALGALWLLTSTISESTVSYNDPHRVTDGGGAYVRGDLLAINSTVSGNKALAGGEGGGLAVGGDALIFYSTIEGNIATDGGGGLKTSGNLTLVNSTISRNASFSGGAMMAKGVSTSIESSTIVLNTSTGRLPGIWLRPYQPISVSLQSSIVANNTNFDSYYGATTEDDIGKCCAAAQAAVTISGAHNIVRSTSISLPPGVATTGVCPLLGVLRDNGGPTSTHALLSHSPGIDEGDSGNLQFDQRGYLRISGIGPDMGAYEIDQDEIVFNGFFDGCPSVD